MLPRRGGSNLGSLSTGPVWSRAYHKSVFFFSFCSLPGSFADVGAMSEMRSKADMSDATGDFCFVPIADIGDEEPSAARWRIAVVSCAS